MSMRPATSLCYWPVIVSSLLIPSRLLVEAWSSKSHRHKHWLLTIFVTIYKSTINIAYDPSGVGRNKAWPHANKGRHNQSKWERSMAMVRRLVPMPIRRMYFGIRLRILSLLGLPGPRSRFNNFPVNRDIYKRSGRS